MDVSGPLSPLSPLDFSLDEFNDLPVFPEAGMLLEEGALPKEMVDKRCSGVAYATLGAGTEVGGSSRGAAFDASLDERFSGVIALQLGLAAPSGSGGGGGRGDRKRKFVATVPDEPHDGSAAPTLDQNKVHGEVRFPYSASSVDHSAPEKPPIQASSGREKAVVTEYVGWSAEQLGTLNKNSSISIIIRLYYEVYPKQKKEIQTFIARVLYQFYLAKSACNDSKKKMDWLEFENKVRAVCSSKYPIFYNLLRDRGFLIMLLFDNLVSYVPGDEDHCFSETAKRKGLVTKEFYTFCQFILREFGEELELLKAEMGILVK